MIKPVTPFLLVIVILCAVTGCGSEKKGTLYVYCDELLEPAFTEIASQFEDASDYTVKLIFNPEDRAFRRMKLSNHADLFVSITPHLIEKTQNYGLSDCGEEICSITPTFITMALNPKNIASMSFFNEEDIRIGIDKGETTTLSTATRQLFEKNGFEWDEICQAIYLPAEDEATMIESIQNNGIDIGIIWTTTGKQQDRLNCVTIPENENVSLPIVAMKLKTTEHPEAVADLVKFMKSPEAQAVWEENGFSKTK